jgi:hypothetical protein
VYKYNNFGVQRIVKKNQIMRPTAFPAWKNMMAFRFCALSAKPNLGSLGI